MRFSFLFLLFVLQFGNFLGKLNAEDDNDVEEDRVEDEEEFKSKFTLDGNVYVLTDKNFDAFIAKNPTALVEFYAPWCGHCKTLAPEYEKAAEQLSGEIPLAKVDATVEKEIAKRFDVNGYPTIKFWLKGQDKPTDYDGERDAEGILSWLKQKTDPNYKPPPEEVVTLTVENFDTFVADKPIMLVEFYAPWCGHCKQLAPEYEKAAQLLKTHAIPLAKVDATVEKRLSDEYGVKGFPTLKILRNGRRFDYDGPRTSDGIVKYMLEQSKPAARLLKSAKEVKAFMAQKDVTIIGFFASDSGRLFEAFTEAAERTRGDFTTGYVLEESVRKELKAKVGNIVLYQPEIFQSKYEPKSKTYSPKGSATAEDLLAFWRDNATPLVGQKTRMNAPTRYSQLPLVVVYYSVDFSLQYREGTQFWRNKVVEIANKYKAKKYRFAVADEEEFTEELASLGLATSGLEHNVVVFGADGKRYPMDPEKYDEDLEENLVSFLNSINKGLEKPHVKSQPLPRDDMSPVKTLVLSNFAKIVNDESKDVLIEFYAPWCGHCKAFEPKYKQFAAKHTKEQTNFIVAKFDATANDVPENYTVEGFPAIYFAPSGKKSRPIKYGGNREMKDLENFVREHAVKSFGKKKDGGKEEL